MKKYILFISITFAAGLLFSNIYNSIVDTKSWGADIPNSIITAREYFKVVNPGTFYRLFSPINQLLALLAVIFFWKTSKSVRVDLAIAFVFYLLGDIFTFAYFYPRNEILFVAPLTNNIEQIRAAWSEWNTMNWVRSLDVLLGLIFSFKGLNKFYSSNKN